MKFEQISRIFEPIIHLHIFTKIKVQVVSSRY